MKQIHIIEKLEEIGYPLDNINLGDFDQIGEHTAKKTRSTDSELYKKVGCFFRPNYERGILIYHLIKKYNLKSFLEIGFGRGYGTVCAAKALAENGGGKLVSIDPLFHNQETKNHADRIRNIFPNHWFAKNDIQLIPGFSQNILLSLNEEFDFVYIDGDHTYQATKSDWVLTKNKFTKFLLFDDYHLPTKKEDNIECAKAIDEIDDHEKELIIMDRRIFFDDRRIPDNEINYGQVLIKKELEE